jgi:hypothetical protein
MHPKADATTSYGTQDKLKNQAQDCRSALDGLLVVFAPKQL